MSPAQFLYACWYSEMTAGQFGGVAAPAAVTRNAGIHPVRPMVAAPAVAPAAAPRNFRRDHVDDARSFAAASKPAFSEGVMLAPPLSRSVCPGLNEPVTFGIHCA